jgi:hypothetical protein
LFNDTRNATAFAFATLASAVTLAFAFAMPVALTNAAAATPPAPFLSVDFNANGSPYTQDGFTAWAISTGNVQGPISQTFNDIDAAVAADGKISVTITFPLLGETNVGGVDFSAGGRATARDRGAIATTGTFTYGDLYRDFIGPAGNLWDSIQKNSHTTLEFSGLVAGRAYEVRLFSFDASNPNRTTIFWDYTTGLDGVPSVASGLRSSITYTSTTDFTATADNSIFSTTVTATANASGTISVRGAGGENSYGLVLNGFQLTALPQSEPPNNNIPEPRTTAAILAALATLAVMAAQLRRLQGKRI